MLRWTFIQPLRRPDDPPPGGGGSGGTPPPGNPPGGDPPPGSGTPGSSQGEPGPVPYDRFKEVNEKLHTTEAERDSLKKKLDEIDSEKAKEQGKWKELYEKTDGELKTERLEKLRLKVAAKKKLPPEMAERLKGDTEEEMEKDADQMLQFLKPQSGPGVPPPSRGGGATQFDLKNMSPEEIRKNKDKILGRS